MAVHLAVAVMMAVAQQTVRVPAQHQHAQMRVDAHWYAAQPTSLTPRVRFCRLKMMGRISRRLRKLSLVAEEPIYHRQRQPQQRLQDKTNAPAAP
jgi:uncharacterized protein YfeS